MLNFFIIVFVKKRRSFSYTTITFSGTRQTQSTHHFTWVFLRQQVGWSFQRWSGRSHAIYLHRWHHLSKNDPVGCSFSLAQLSIGQANAYCLLFKLQWNYCPAPPNKRLYAISESSLYTTAQGSQLQATYTALLRWQQDHGKGVDLVSGQNRIRWGWSVFSL